MFKYKELVSIYYYIFKANYMYTFEAKAKNRPTFLNTMGSSSQTGFTAFPCDVLVLNAFLLVSTGKPNISTST